MYETIREACQAWVNGFDAVPCSVLEKLMEYDGSVQEITPPSISDRVEIIYDEYAGEHGDIIEVNVDNTEGYYKIKLDSGTEILKYKDDFEVIEKEGWLPIWSTLWSFNEKIDEDWARGTYCESHLQEMADLGFRLYDTEDFGLVFGIDGAGYDFYGTEEYPCHWINLYKARGLHWHKKEE